MNCLSFVDYCKLHFSFSQFFANLEPLTICINKDTNVSFTCFKVMAIMGVILFELDGLDTRLFLNAFDAWYVVFICVTQDGWNTILDDFRKQPYFGLMSVYLIFGVSIGSFVFANLIVAVIVANLELSVRELRKDKSSMDNPLLLNYVSGTGVPIVPVMERLRTKTFIYRRQKPMELPPINKFSAKRLSNYVQLNVALEQNMLEAEVLKNDLERVISVLLSTSLQVIATHTFIEKSCTPSFLASYV